MQPVLETADSKLKDRMTHYDIYIYKGWTLQEVQESEIIDRYDANIRKWTKEFTGNLKTVIVWGIHQPCGARGFIFISSTKVHCSKCKETMPSDVYENMKDALEMMKSTLDYKAGDL